MGVNGLWTVIQPCARPTNLATLNRKRLAVDASIWIYQFLKAVRDKEGNALRNSHIVGFFRRICKLLWFGIQPIFVFDGGAPALKRATLQKRQRRREGRRDDAVRTAGKLLAVQMQRHAVEEQDRRKKERDGDVAAREARLQENDSSNMDASRVVYLNEVGMSQQERVQTRRFHKQDAYHLPALDGGIAAMGKPDDPRIMSVDELEEYARQFNNGEDVNLYDFSKIDFDGDFFKSLPPADRYNILNAARLRSRLRLGYSKDQLDDMFPDRMAFSRFQIERVKERNHLTQRLMAEAGMHGTDLTLGVNGRVAGEKDREYILVKNEGAEGGWALGVVSKEKDLGEEHKPIDIDAIEVQYQTKDDDANEEEGEDDFEDVPIEGLNRLPKPRPGAAVGMAEGGQMDAGEAEEGSLFVGGNTSESRPLFGNLPEEPDHPEEADDINRAIALSLKNQHELDRDAGENESEEEQAEEPQWTQRAVESSKPIGASAGSMIAHIVNNRANAAVPKAKEEKTVGNDSDSDSDDLQTMLTRSRNTARTIKPKPTFENKKNPFDGPLPFPKLDWKSSVFAPKTAQKAAAQKKTKPSGSMDKGADDDAGAEVEEEEDDQAGGFDAGPEQDGPKPLPPWLVDETDIRESLKVQHDVEREINAEDRQEAEEEARLLRKDMQSRTIEIESSSESDGGSDVEIIEAPSLRSRVGAGADNVGVDGGAPDDVELSQGKEAVSATGQEGSDATRVAQALDGEEGVSLTEVDKGSATEAREPLPGVKEASPDVKALTDVNQISTDVKQASPDVKEDSPNVERSLPGVNASTDLKEASPDAADDSASPEPEFQDVPAVEASSTAARAASRSESPLFDEDDDTAEVSTSNLERTTTTTTGLDDDVFAGAEVDDEDEYSDPGDEELLMHMAEEAEEHARFASELNHKSEAQNREDYEKELRALRNQQKKDRRDADEVTQVMVGECQSLLQLFGIPYITAPMEAEAQCAELVRLGIVDGIVTDDSDTFLFGGTRVYKNMFNGNKFVECYLGADLEKEMSLTREQLIALAQLLGSDYTEGLSGVGPVTAVEILSEFPGRHGLDEFRAWWTAVQTEGRPREADAGSPFRSKFRRAQATKLFLPLGFPNPAVFDAYLRPEVDDSGEAFQWGVPDVEGLRRFLMATIRWSKERTDEVLVPVVRDMNRREVEGTQSNITRFFGGSVGVGARGGNGTGAGGAGAGRGGGEAFAPRQQRSRGSKRMAAAVDRLRSNLTGGEEGVTTGAAGDDASSNKRRKRGRP